MSGRRGLLASQAPEQSKAKRERERETEREGERGRVHDRLWNDLERNFEPALAGSDRDEGCVKSQTLENSNWGLGCSV